MGAFLVINPASGDSSPSADELSEAAEERGVTPHVLRDGEDPAAFARESGAEVLGIAGGDGSLATVAAVAIERDLPFVTVPFGTRNHFARDLGLDRDDPLGALEAFEGTEQRIDVGRVGERLFLNNVSLGLYADLVHRREHHRGRREALAGARALWRAGLQREALRVTIEGKPVAARVVLVANNAYELKLFDVGERRSLTEGLLFLYEAAGWLPSSWAERKGERFTVDAPDGQLSAAVDGEPVTLELPVEFRIQPKALRVLVPGAPD